MFTILKPIKEFYFKITWLVKVRYYYHFLNTFEKKKRKKIFFKFFQYNSTLIRLLVLGRVIFVLQVMQQLDHEVLFLGQLHVDFELVLLEDGTLVGDLGIERLEVIENGQVFQVRDDLAQRLGRLDDVGGADLDLERVHVGLAHLAYVVVVISLKWRNSLYRL